MGRGGGYENRDLSLKQSDAGNSQYSDKCERKESEELNNNTICIDPGKAPTTKVCNLGDLDSLIQNQYDVLNKAVINILAVSSDDIYAKHKSQSKIHKNVNYTSRENFTRKESTFDSIVEDLEFKEALCRFSEESLSMSAENILQTTSLKCVSRKKPTHKSLNILDKIAEGKFVYVYFDKHIFLRKLISTHAWSLFDEIFLYILYFILICS